MNFTPFAAPLARAGTVLRGASLGAMSRSVGIVVSAGVLAAIYQLTHEETRAWLRTWRSRAHYRRARHEALLIQVLGSELPIPLQERFLASRDAFWTALELLADATVSAHDRKAIRCALQYSMTSSEGVFKSGPEAA
jgi:hypothetical protein